MNNMSQESENFKNSLPAMADGLGVPIMTSHEIADLTGKRHDNVLVDIRKMLTELYGKEGLLKFQDTLRNGQNGQPYAIYGLPKRETLILVSGYSVEMRARIIDRWQELEERNHNDPMEALRNPKKFQILLLENVTKRIEAEKNLEAAKETVTAYNRIAGTDGSLCIRDGAKALQVRPKDLTAWLMANKWIYKRLGKSGWLGYQDKIQTGCLTHKVTAITLEDGTERIKEQVRITPKGLAKLAKIVPGAQLAEVAASQRFLTHARPGSKKHPAERASQYN